MINSMIGAERISLCYRMNYDRVESMKEYFVQYVKGQVKYKEFWALKDVSFEVRKGEVLGIIGHNGAGKSTLLKVISGILKPTDGHIAVNGTVVPMLELGSGFDFDLTGRENIFLNGAILGYSEKFLKEKYEEIVAFSGLGQFIDVPLRNYSSGMVMRLAFSVATVVNPDILIVDEILAVGDADFQEKSKKRMLELMSGGTTVLFVSHSLDQIREMCDRVLWLDHGQVKMLGDARLVCNAYKSRTLPSESCQTDKINEIKLPARAANIEISSVCNAKCRWCTTGIQNRVCQEKAHFMTPELFERGVDRLLELGWITKETVIEVYNWGEPFLNPQLDDILRILVDKGIVFRLSSNGSVYRKLSPDVVEKMEHLMISVPGMSQASYDKIHQLNAKRVRENVERFAQDLEECGASNKLCLNFHVYQFNLNEIDKARRFIERLGGVFLPHTAYFNDYRLCQEYLTEKIGQQDLRDASSQLFMDWYHPQDVDPNYKCLLWNQLCFDHEFNLVPCCRLTTDEQLGNLLTDSSDDLLREWERFPTCRECIVSGQSSHILNAPQPEWYTRNLLLKLKQERLPARVYFNYGYGETEDESLSVPVDSEGWIHQRIDLPENCKSVRFDPIEGMGCLVRNLQVRTDSVFLGVKSSNGACLGDSYMFESLDPQIYFEDLPDGALWLELDAEIELTD